MENKKLINILLKDVEELEGLISDIKIKKEFNFLEIEFLHTRTKGILQLMQMLKNFESEIKTPLEIKEEKIVVVEEIKTPAVEKEPETSTKKTVEPEVVKVEEKVSETKPKVETPIILPESNIATSNIELEETNIKTGNRLGDKFIKEKSVNDIVEGNNKLEFKLSNRPISNIQAAIGINDRFQYIRELFDGSSEKYTSTITALDSMSNINEAVNYIQQNFKWKKNETSLKFINIVKRRFPQC